MIRSVSSLEWISVQLSRRTFLGVARKGRGEVLRPPWALPEQAFQERCSRCGDCVSACPTHLLVSGGGAYPEADFNPARTGANCTFCAACVDTCATGALVRQTGVPPWTLRAVINGDCLTSRQVVCYTCRDQCEFDAIRFQWAVGGMAVPLVEAGNCNGCGACIADCPTQAIRIQSIPINSQGL